MNKIAFHEAYLSHECVQTGIKLSVDLILKYTVSEIRIEGLFYII